MRRGRSKVVDKADVVDADDDKCRRQGHVISGFKWRKTLRAWVRKLTGKAISDRQRRKLKIVTRQYNFALVYGPAYASKAKGVTGFTAIMSDSSILGFVGRKMMSFRATKGLSPSSSA